MPSTARQMQSLRILVRPHEGISVRRVRSATRRALAATRWGGDAAVRVAPIAPDVPDTLLIEIEVVDPIGSRRYAQRAHQVVQLLYDSMLFERVEADIPVDTFGRDVPAVRTRARGAGGDDRCDRVPAATPGNWALLEMRVPAAQALMPRLPGVGVRVGHPDSGYSDHGALGLAHLDLDNDRDVISGDNDAADPLRPPKKRIFNVLPNPGHGTSTASVIVGDGNSVVGSPGAGLAGVAPAAVLVPIRATESVVQLFDSDVAKAVDWARLKGCHIVSMSLGGKGLFGLRDAIGRAVDAGMIVMAAAGNRVGFVTAPASYDNCLAVAATGPAASPWSGSSRGDAVDVSAPGACVWAAMFNWKKKPPERIVDQSHGSSYSVAHLAGVAALWLSMHGHDALVARYGRGNIQSVFLRVLNRPGVCRRSAGWEASEWGAGVIDAEALLSEPLPSAAGGAAPTSASGSSDDPIERIAAQVCRPPEEVARWLESALGTGASADKVHLRRYEGELVYLLLTDPEFRDGLDRPARAAAAPERVPRAASPQLRALLRS